MIRNGLKIARAFSNGHLARTDSLEVTTLQISTRLNILYFWVGTWLNLLDQEFLFMENF